jgi:hypothetical protein
MNDVDFGNRLAKTFEDVAISISNMNGIIGDLLPGDISEFVASITSQSTDKNQVQDNNPPSSTATRTLAHALTVIHFISRTYESDQGVKDLNEAAYEKIGFAIDRINIEFHSFKGNYELAKKNHSIYRFQQPLRKAMITMYESYLELADSANGLLRSYNSDHPHRLIISEEGYSSLPV